MGPASTRIGGNPIGRTLVRSITGGASRYDGKSFTKFTDKEGLGNNDVALARIAMPTSGRHRNGVSRYDGKSMTNFTTKDGSSRLGHTIVQDVFGANLVCPGGGIRSDGKAEPIPADQVGRSFVNVRWMVVDRSGTPGSAARRGPSVTTARPGDVHYRRAVGCFVAG